MEKRSRREFLAAAGVGAAALVLPGAEPVISRDDLGFLKQLARDTIASATKKTSAGFDFVTPGGNYPSFWIRDFSMAAGCGLLAPRTILEHLNLAARLQNGLVERKLKSGGILPPGAVADHINFQGGAVFYPGTYSSGEDQGGEPWGVLPPADDHFELIHLAYCYWKRTFRTDFLMVEIGGVRLFDRLIHALDCPVVDPANGLFMTDFPRRAVGFGFCDGVHLTGHVLFPSLQRWRALGEMIDMARALKISEGVAEWKQTRDLIRVSIPKVFDHKDGWLIAATKLSRQPDVWGMAFGCHLGVLDLSYSRKLAIAYHAGTICLEGGVRHVPTTHNFSAVSAWEKTVGQRINTYQNGAYWHTPTGWLASALARVDRELARKLISEMVAHFQREDFRKGGGGPWECFHPDGNHRQNPIYMASVTMPYEIVSGL